MKISKQLVAVATVATLGVGGLGVGMASAATGAANDPGDSLALRLAQKFNLDKDEVKKVLDEDRQAHEAERQKEVESELAQLVKDGKLTSAQKDAILAKRKVLQAERETHKDSMRSKNDTERKAAMDTKKAELEAWAKENSISNEYLRYFMGGPGAGHGPGGPARPGSER